MESPSFFVPLNEVVPPPAEPPLPPQAATASSAATARAAHRPCFPTLRITPLILLARTQTPVCRSRQIVAASGAPVEPAVRRFEALDTIGRRGEPTGLDPELLHHRAHRPRQVDPRRPAPRADRHHERAGHGRAGARRDG